MYAKAILICDDVRLEVGGSMTLVGVRGERLVGARQGERVVFPRLAFVTVVGGLAGVSQVRFRHVPFTGVAPPMREEPHDPAADEHTFVLGDAPFVFARPGRHELATEVEAGAERATYRYAFHVDAG